MKKLSIICAPGLESFIRDIGGALSLDYAVSLVLPRTTEEIETAVREADIVWLEWANETAIEALRLPAIEGKKVVVRLHSYEALSGYLPLLDWGRVHRLILVSRHMGDVCEMVLPGLTGQVQTMVIPNGVDIRKHPFKARAHGKNIGWVCDISHKKGPMLIPQVMHELAAADPEYHLYVAGAHQEARYELYLKHMLREMGIAEKVTFHGRQSADMMHFFYGGIDYLLSCSPHEGHPVNIIEGMARGIMPVIHNFYGARDLYPPECLWNTVGEAADIIRNGRYESYSYRAHVRGRGWTLEHQMADIRELLRGLDEQE